MDHNPQNGHGQSTRHHPAHISQDALQHNTHSTPGSFSKRTRIILRILLALQTALHSGTFTAITVLTARYWRILASPTQSGSNNDDNISDGSSGLSARAYLISLIVLSFVTLPLPFGMDISLSRTPHQIPRAKRRTLTKKGWVVCQGSLVLFWAAMLGGAAAVRARARGSGSTRPVVAAVVLAAMDLGWTLVYCIIGVVLAHAKR